MIYICEDKSGYIKTEERHTEAIYIYNTNLIELFLNIKNISGLSINTIKNYRITLEELSHTLGKKLDSATTEDIRLVLSKIKNKGTVKNITLDNIRRVYSSFYNFLVLEDYINKSPILKVGKIKYDKVVKTPFSDEEMVRICDYVKNNVRDRAIIDILYSTGIRISELTSINIEDVDLKNREIIVYGKGAKERIVYFNAKAKIHIEDYLNKRKDNNKALFVTLTKPVKRLTKGSIEKLLKDIGDSCGVSNCHPHRFRRSMATDLLRSGMPIEQVQRLLGHSKIETTLIYSYVAQDTVKYNHSRLI